MRRRIRREPPRTIEEDMRRGGFPVLTKTRCGRRIILNAGTGDMVVAHEQDIEEGERCQ